MKAAIYVRFSSDNQRDESIDAQIRAIGEFAKKNKYEIVKTYEDRAKSATSDKRPGFQEMIKDSALDIFDIVIVHKLDRFARDKYDSALYKRRLKQNGVRLISVVENLDGSPESVILESVIEGMAEYYSKNLAREVMKGMKETAYQCKHTGGVPPLGYDVDKDKKYIINEEEAKCVRLIFEKYIDGYSHSEIIDELNLRGFKTKAGVIFRRNSLHSILTNEKYTGVYVYNKSAKKDEFGRRNNHSFKDESEVIRIEGGMPNIVSKEDFQKVSEILKRRKKRPGANKAKENYLLSGIIRCGECGYAMQGNRRLPKGKPLYVSYRCSCRQQRSTTVCSNKEIRKEYIEEYVLTELEKHVFNDNAIPVIVEKINEHIINKAEEYKDKRSAIDEKLKDINVQINNIVNAITSGFIQEEFKERMEKLKKEKFDLEQRLLDINSNENTPVVTANDVKQICSTFKKFVVSRNIPECKKFIQDFVKEVLIFKDHVEVIFNMAFLLPKNSQNIDYVSKVKRIKLFEIYSNSFCIKDCV